MATVDTQQPNPVCIGCDIGQIHDPSAVCVAEVSQVSTGKFRYDRRVRVPAHVDDHLIFHKAVDAEPVLRSEYTIRHIARLPLNTSYPAVAEYLANLLCNPLFAHRDVRCLLDVTGVGRGVYDLLRQEVSLREAAKHVQVKPITFSHGEKYNRSTGVLAKAFLVSRLQSLLQAGRVHGPDTKEMQATLDELKVYEIKLNNDGADQYGAFKTGTHDDLATALGLAVLTDPWSERVMYSQRVY